MIKTYIEIFGIVIVIFILCVLFFTVEKTNEQFIVVKNDIIMSEEEYLINEKDKIIWAYWENIDQNIPTHIQLCLETFKKHLSDKYKLIILNQNTIKIYLPEIRMDLDDLMIAQKVDYYRIALLYKYGGIWIDADTIIMRDLDEVFEKLEKYDFVGFGCTEFICFNGKNQPSNGVLASQKHGKLMKLCLDKLNEKLNKRNKSTSLNYYDLGKYIIWEALNELKLSKYDYYHFPSEYDGTRDINGIWIDTNRHFSEEDIKLINEDKLLFVFLTNAGINIYQPWVKTATRNDIFNGNYWISKMFRKSLN